MGGERRSGDIVTMIEYACATLGARAAEDIGRNYLSQAPELLQDFLAAVRFPRRTADT